VQGLTRPLGLEGREDTGRWKAQKMAQGEACPRPRLGLLFVSAVKGPEGPAISHQGTMGPQTRSEILAQRPAEGSGHTDEETKAGSLARATGPEHGGASRARGRLTQVVCHLVRIPQVLHTEADDVHKIFHQPEKLLGIGAHLGEQPKLGEAPTSQLGSSSPPLASPTSLLVPFLLGPACCSPPW
jgi:hypothetical protein